MRGNLIVSVYQSTSSDLVSLWRRQLASPSTIFNIVSFRYFSIKLSELQVSNNKWKTISDRKVGCCLEPKENGANLGGEGERGLAPEAESKISSQLPAEERTIPSWSRKNTTRRVRHDKEDPSCTEWGLLNIFSVPYECPLAMCVNVINVIKPSLYL
jgi:hypothetical protein